MDIEWWYKALNIENFNTAIDIGFKKRFYYVENSHMMVPVPHKMCYDKYELD
jgi:hypothetical protein